MTRSESASLTRPGKPLTRLPGRIPQLWTHAFHLSASLQLQRTFYRATHLLAYPLLGFDPFLKLIAPRRLARMRRFLERTGLAEKHRLHQVMRQQLLEEIIRARPQNKLLFQRLTPANCHSTFQVTNWRAFEEAQLEKRGVLFALSHYGLPSAFIEYLRLYGFEGPVIRRGVKARLHKANKAVTAQTTMMLSTRDLVAAHRSLRAGRVAFILPDGAQGDNTLLLPLFERKRKFQTGFAELALSSKALVIPVTVLPQVGGKLHITFYAPFHSASTALPHRQRVQLLVEQYAAHLAQIWSQSPGSVFPLHVKHHLNASDRYV